MHVVHCLIWGGAHMSLEEAKIMCNWFAGMELSDAYHVLVAQAEKTHGANNLSLQVEIPNWWQFSSHIVIDTFWVIYWVCEIWVGNSFIGHLFCH